MQPLGMGLKMTHGTEMQEKKCQTSRLGSFHPSEVVLLKHKRSKSDACREVMDKKLSSSSESLQRLKLVEEKAKSQMDIKMALSPDAGVQSSLKQEIKQLEKRLQDQFVVRGTLEKALGYKPFAPASTANDTPIPKPAEELIMEIAVLELEVLYLEHYLLSLYRKAFDEQISTPSSSDIGNRSKWSISSSSRLFQDVAELDILSKRRDEAINSSQATRPQKSTTNPASESCVLGFPKKLIGPSVQRSQSALPQWSTRSSRMSPSAENQARALRSCYSQPMTFVEDEQNPNSGVISLANYLGTNIADHVPETPNLLSEDMVRCISAIYCKIREPPLVHQGLSSSPASSFSSLSASSPQYLGYIWSPGIKRESTLEAWLDNPFGVKGLREFNGPYNAMMEVPMICRDRGKLSDIEGMLQNYKSLVQRLERVDPKKMKKEEKLAFWINIHNALMMHAYIDYGVPRTNMKRASLLTKASYIIGGCVINANIIQNYILGCWTNLPGQWLRIFLLSKLKIRTGDQLQTYAIEHAEPLLRFALCSGSHSDPAIRIYTPKRLFQQLETAREEYIRATLSIFREEKILVPKVIHVFAKETSLSTQNMLEMIQRYLPEALQIVMQRCLQGRSRKIVEWVPHNSTFRYLLSRELAIPQIKQ